MKTSRRGDALGAGESGGLTIANHTERRRDWGQRSGLCRATREEGGEGAACGSAERGASPGGMGPRGGAEGALGTLGTSSGARFAAGGPNLGHVLHGGMSSRPFAPVVVPPLPEQRGEAYVRLVEIMQRLLAPDGCPWDREQSPTTLRRYVLEEACEVIDAIDSGDRAAMREELGDVLLQVVFLGEIMRNEGSFGPDDIVQSIADKLVRRHPHVFGDTKVTGSEQVLQNWEKIKAAEKKDRGLLDSVPRSMPALTRAQRVGEKVERVGFDWPDARGSRAKVSEELGELDQAIAEGDPARIEEELGDVFFALVNLARHTKVDAEGALRKTIEKFQRRFSHVEARVKEVYGGFSKVGSGDYSGAKFPLEVLDGYWEEAKQKE
jgi:MazG family protein